MNLRNRIKAMAKEKKVPLWRIAQEFGGMSDSNFSRMLRYDDKVSKETEEKIYKIIDKLAEQ